MLRILLILAFALQPLAALRVANCADAADPTDRADRANRLHASAGLSAASPDSAAAPLSASASSSACCAVEVAVEVEMIETEPVGCSMMMPIETMEAPACACEMSEEPARRNGEPVSDGFPVQRPGDFRSIELLTILRRSTMLDDVDLRLDSVRRSGLWEFDGRRIAALTHGQAHALLCVWQT